MYYDIFHCVLWPAASHSFPGFVYERLIFVYGTIFVVVKLIGSPVKNDILLFHSKLF